MKVLPNNITWKLIAIMLLINIAIQGWNLFSMEEDIGVIRAFYFMMYIMCLIGIIGLALNKRILIQSVWKFMFGISSLVFVYTVFISLLALLNPISVPSEVPTTQVILLLFKYIYNLIILFVVVYGINLYANKSENLW